MIAMQMFCLASWLFPSVLPGPGPPKPREEARCRSTKLHIHLNRRDQSDFVRIPSYGAQQTWSCTLSYLLNRHGHVLFAKCFFVHNLAVGITMFLVAVFLN